MQQWMTSFCCHSMLNYCSWDVFRQKLQEMLFTITDGEKICFCALHGHRQNDKSIVVTASIGSIVTFSINSENFPFSPCEAYAGLVDESTYEVSIFIKCMTANHP